MTADSYYSYLTPIQIKFLQIPTKCTPNKVIVLKIQLVQI